MATKKLPSSPCKWTAYPNPMDRIYEVLGVATPGRVIPKDLHGEWKIDGWQIVVKRSGPAAKGGKPRVFVRHDGRLIPAGRVRQALCRHDVHEAQKRATRTRGAKGRFTYSDPKKQRTWITKTTSWKVEDGVAVPQFQLKPTDASLDRRKKRR